MTIEELIERNTVKHYSDKEWVQQRIDGLHEYNTQYLRYRRSVRVEVIESTRNLISYYKSLQNYLAHHKKEK